MNEVQREQSIKFRAAGNGYGTIATVLSLNENTVKSFCRRNNINKSDEPIKSIEGHFCKCCGIPVKQNEGRKEKKFCSDRCRNKWWNAHLPLVDRRANYEIVCPTCSKVFSVYGNKRRKYCSNKCYVAGRFGGGAHE